MPDAARECLTDDLRFQRPWRPYQQRVLDGVDRLLADRRLHVVAAPGSGKTSLGLEVFRRLERPALVLSPTTPIRDQWVARLVDFLPAGGSVPPWASCELGRPGFLTSITYQALHVRLRASGDDEEEAEEANGEAPDDSELVEVVALLARARIGTIILDEAHHLRQEWWKALKKLIAAFPGVTVLSFTATPPYDVAAREWRRYEELCGPIDEEISAPELVRSGVLCPHQDFVWAVEAPPAVVERLREHASSVDQLLAELLADEVLAAAVAHHPWMAPSGAQEEQVLEEPELATALLVYAKARGERLPAPLLRILGADEGAIPRPSERWWQVLLEAYLQAESWAPDEHRLVHRDALAKRLRAHGLLHRRDLRLARPPPAAELELAASPTKIEGCLRIHEVERAARGEALRQVFLTDFIRDEDGNGSGDARLGAWPLFRALVQAQGAGCERIALLTGRLAIVHEKVAPGLRALVSPRAPLETEAVAGLPGFVRLLAPGNTLVAPLTRLLASGGVRALVATRALLGEGWDAPAVNSLVLVSYAASYVLTNQMRGRAIRTDRTAQDKIASIWHVVSVAPGVRSGWHDVEELGRRFELFAGVGATAPVIETGIARLRLPPRRPMGWAADVDRIAHQRIQALGDVRSLWERSVGSVGAGRVLPGIRVERPPKMRSTLVANTLLHLLYVACSTFGAVFSLVMREARPQGREALLWTLALASAAALAVTLPRFIRCAWIALRHLPVDGSVRQIATSVYEALAEAGVVARVEAKPAVQVNEIHPGVFRAAVLGASYRDAVVFADALGEVLAPIENPRYLVTRPGIGFWLHRRPDYHAVPELLGARKETAELFHAAWRRYVGGGALVYTRTAEGRRELVRARVRAFSGAFAPRARRLDRWQ